MLLKIFSVSFEGNNFLQGMYFHTDNWIGSQSAISFGYGESCIVCGVMCTLLE